MRNIATGLTTLDGALTRSNNLTETAKITFKTKMVWMRVLYDRSHRKTRLEDLIRRNNLLATAVTELKAHLLQQPQSNMSAAPGADGEGNLNTAARFLATDFIVVCQSHCVFSFYGI